MIDNIYSAYHYHKKCKEDREAIEKIAPDVLNAAKNAVSGNIGDIKYTLRTEVPYGGFWCDGSIKTQEDLPNIYNMLLENKLNVLDVETYNNILETNGSCGFFGLDTANKLFKLPALNDVYIKAGQNIDEFCAESLPNITGSWTSQYNISQDNNSTCVGAISSTYSTEQGYYGGTSAGADWGYGFNFDASKSNTTYKNDAKVNPDHIKYRAYIILFSGEKELSLVNWTKELQNYTENLKKELIAFGTTTITYWD